MSQGKYDELRDLLRSWDVCELLSHFKDESINVQELQMLKRHHMNDILRGFRYGTRIRFEHNFERWRRWLNLPLVNSQSHCAGCRCHDPEATTCALEAHTAAEVGAIELQQQRQQQQQLQHQLQQEQENQLHHQHQQQQQSGTQRSSLDLLEDRSNVSMPEPLVALNEIDTGTLPVPLSMPMAMPMAAGAASSANVNLLQAPMMLAKTDMGAGVNSIVDNVSANSETVDIQESGVSVLGILQAAGKKAEALLTLQGRSVELQQPQRLLLIQLICNYYWENNLHLTLQRSHLLEQEILKLFPREQLSFYRTERRGKMYVKFTNMKRFKRENRESKRRREDNNISMPPTTYLKKELRFADDSLSNQ